MAGTATRLVLRGHAGRHVEAECLDPGLLAGRNAREIGALPVRIDGEAGSLGDVFFIEPGLTDHVALEGDLSRVDGIGKSMRYGTLTVQGNAGDHLGAGMRGGSITVEGNAGDDAGAGMNGGVIRVKGDVGHRAGSRFGAGSADGPGTVGRSALLIEGGAGTELGSAMRRGVIAVQGDTGDRPGAEMEGGTIFVFGRLGNRAGAGNRRGTIVVLGQIEEIPATYAPGCTYASMFLSQAHAWLRERGLDIPEGFGSGTYLRHRGDMNVNGKGEILVFCKSQ